MNLKKIGKIFTSKFVGTGPSSYKKRIYWATVSQRLRNTVLDYVRNYRNLKDSAPCSKLSSPRCCWCGFITSSCRANCSFGTMFLMRNASMSPFENTPCHGKSISFADLSDGCQLTSALLSFWRITGYTVVSRRLPKSKHALITICLSYEISDL